MSSSNTLAELSAQRDQLLDALRVLRADPADETAQANADYALARADLGATLHDEHYRRYAKLEEVTPGLGDIDLGRR